MILHLIKLIWNRRWKNLRIIIQIALSFLATFAVTAWAVHYYDNYQQPLGYKYENVWQIQVTPKITPDEEMPLADRYNRLVAALREFDEIEEAGVMNFSPYIPWEFGRQGGKVNGNGPYYTDIFTTIGILDVLGLKLLKGRWFSKEDKGEGNFTPIVINSYLEREVFEGKDALGEIFPNTNYRVIGVIEEYRDKGELSDPGGCIFHKFGDNPVIKENGGATQRILFKVRPDTKIKALFESNIIAGINTRLGPEAGGWVVFDFKPLSKRRDIINKPRLISVFIGAIITGFLLIMVTLGLTGVMWLNVTRRTMEIGLRRAKGATKGNIRNQIIGELSIITGFGLIIGLIILTPAFPIVVFINLVSAKVYIISIIISAALVFGISLLCSLYPGMLAARMTPAQALHYE